MKYIMETERLRFRKISDDDFSNLKKIISDKETMKYYPKPYDDEGVNKWINWCKDCYKKYGFGLWAIELKDNTFIGDCGITKQDIDGDIVFEIGYHFNKKYWHNGYASEAAKASKKWFFNNTPHKEVYSYMNIDNLASCKVAINNEMTFVKDYHKDNEHLVVYKITKDEYINNLSLKEKVYKYLTEIPKGKVVTYGQIGKHLGNKKMCRAIGNILHVNPDPINQPCFKVVNAKGELAKNFGDGINVQAKRLKEDGVEVINYKVDLNKYQWKKDI